MERAYTWSSIFAWGLTLSGATLATGGVIGMFWPQFDITWLCVVAFAAMMAFGIGLVNCSAAGALQAIKHRKPDGRRVDWAVLLPALACCAGFAFATNIGIHFGWEILTANAPAGAKLPPVAVVDAVFYVFALAKPAMAWIVEGRKTMDAEDYAARQAARRKEAADIAAAEQARAEIARSQAARPETAKMEPVRPEPAAAPVAAEPQPAPSIETAPSEHEAPAKSRRTKRRARTIEEQRAAAMRAAARRGEQYREQYMSGRLHNIEEARWDQTLTPQQIAQACDVLIGRGKKPTIRGVADHLGVSEIRVERIWPKGVPLDGTGETRAA